MSIRSLRNSTDPAAAPGVLAELVDQGAKQFVVMVLEKDDHLTAFMFGEPTVADLATHSMYLQRCVLDLFDRKLE